VTAARVRVTNRAGKWTCKGPQGHVGKGRTRWAAMVAYATRGRRWTGGCDHAMSDQALHQWKNPMGHTQSRSDISQFHNAVPLYAYKCPVCRDFHITSQQRG